MFQTEIDSFIDYYLDEWHANNYPEFIKKIQAADMRFAMITAKAYSIESDFFALFIDAMIKFFDTGETPVTPEQTIDVIAVREAGIKALEKPFVWVEV